MTLILLLLSFASLVIGFVNLLRKKRNSFYYFIIAGLFSTFLGQLYYFILELAGGNSMVFSLGSLGTFSGLVFFAYANFTVQRDEKTRFDKKYDYIPLVAPAIFVVVWIVMALSHLGFEKMIIITLYIFAAGACSYISLRNIIMPSSQSKYNGNFKPLFFVILILNILAVISEFEWMFIDKSISSFVSIALIIGAGICYISIPLLLERGYNKWKM